MAHYLLSVVTPTEATMPSEDQLGEIMARVAAFEAELRTAGAWVFSGGLEAPDTATVLRPGADEVLVTDGPFAEGKEYLGGLTILSAPDLDAALEWGRRAVAAVGLPIEVRPFHWNGDPSDASDAATGRSGD